MNSKFSTNPTKPSNKQLIQPHLTLPPELLAKTFPFHFAFQRDRIIVQAGDVLQRLMPDIIGKPFDQYFKIDRPIVSTDLVSTDFDTIGQKSDSVFLLKALSPEMRLRGQMTPLPSEDAIFFLGRPVVTEINQLSEMGLKLNDFATHDSVADFLFLLKVKEKLTNELTQHQKDLQQSLAEKNEISTLLEARAQELEKTIERLKTTQTQLIQTEKMSSLGQMVAGIAHEINNPVNFIDGNINHLETYTQDLITLLGLYQKQFPKASPEILDCTEDIDLTFLLEDLSRLIPSMKEGSRRISEIVVSLRNFSRLDESGKKESDIHHGIDSTLLILNHKLKQGIEVVKDYGHLPRLQCYPAQLNQVFMNILSNAADALSESTVQSKRISIKTSHEDDKFICVSIKDNGGGMPEAIRKDIFTPFFTTKPIGQGTGLGLSISHQIIEKHGGEIEVFSEPGNGTEFRIKVPVA